MARKDATLTGRVPLWHLVDAEIGRHLVFGFGYQAFWSEANPAAWRLWASAGWNAPHAHSGFRDVLLNFGLVGFVVIAATIGRAMRQGAALHCGQPEKGWLWINLLMVWFLVLNLAESVMFVQNDALFVLFAAAILSCGLRRRSSTASRRRGRWCPIPHSAGSRPPGPIPSDEPAPRGAGTRLTNGTHREDKAMSIVELLPASARLSKRALPAWLGGEPELRLLPRLCRPDELSLDIGANYGVYSWHLARLSRGVVAFEPQPGPADFIRRGLGGRVRVERVALSDAEGEVVLRVPRDRMQDGRATVEPGNTLDALDATEIVVPRRRLDGYDLPRVGFVKVDVEGHELATLAGARGLLERDRPSLIVEAEDRHRPGAVDSVAAFLAGLGYRGAFLRAGTLRPLHEIAAGGLGAGAAAAGVNNFVFAARPEVVATLAA